MNKNMHILEPSELPSQLFLRLLAFLAPLVLVPEEDSTDTGKTVPSLISFEIETCSIVLPASRYTIKSLSYNHMEKKPFSHKLQIQMLLNNKIQAGPTSKLTNLFF